VEDLAPKNPFPGIPEVRYLDADFFGEYREDELRGAELKLNSKAAAEAVLRLPASLVHYYVRSLRLEERYPAAEATIRSLEAFLRCVYDQVGLRNSFAWLPQEQERLARTRIEREKADELFRRCDFVQASEAYSLCLRIDSDSSGFEGFGGGGRLHAVLHCNRAACLMAQKKYEEALAECSAALRIHPRYMKAMLRRARCYSRLDRLNESIVEFQRWIDLVRDAKTCPQAVPIFLSPCLFDGPHEVSDSDAAQVKTELDEVVKMKAKIDETARAEAQYRREHQRRQNARFDAEGDSRRERDYAYGQHNSSSRRWGSFSDRGANSRTTYNNATRGRGTSSDEEYILSPKSMAAEKNHYKVLGLQSNASDGDIKKAYKKLALKYHPDKNKDDDAVDTFRRVKEAYEVLGDSGLRRKYDQDLRWRRI
jgi:tetratricopeptide (TPR) repeat protein